jgi:hypothetical protein
LCLKKKKKKENVSEMKSCKELRKENVRERKKKEKKKEREMKSKKEERKNIFV